MRKLLIVLITLLMVVTSSFARKPVEKAGEVENNVFTDKKFGYQLTLNDLWKHKINKDKDEYRLILIKNKYEIPPDYLDAPDYTMIPRIDVFYGKTKMTVSQFIDSLLSESYNSDQKKEILKEFEILSTAGGSGMTKEKILPRKRKPLTVNDVRGHLWTGQVKYRNEVSTSASSSGGKRVYGAYGGSIIGFKNDKDEIILFHIISEWVYFENTMKDAMDIINTLKMPQ